MCLVLLQRFLNYLITLQKEYNYYNINGKYSPISSTQSCLIHSTRIHLLDRAYIEMDFHERTSHVRFLSLTLTHGQTISDRDPFLPFPLLFPPNPAESEFDNPSRRTLEPSAKRFTYPNPGMNDHPSS